MVNDAPGRVNLSPTGAGTMVSFPGRVARPATAGPARTADDPRIARFVGHRGGDHAAQALTSCGSRGIDLGRRLAVRGGAVRRDGDGPGPQPACLRGGRGVAHGAGRDEARRPVQHRRRRGGQRLGPAPPADAAARGRRDGGGAGRRLRCGRQLHQGLGRSGRRLRVAPAGARPAHRSRRLRLAGRQQLSHQRSGAGRAGQRRSDAQVHAGRHAGPADRPQQPEPGQRRHDEPQPAGGPAGPSADQRAVRGRRLRQPPRRRVRRG